MAAAPRALPSMQPRKKHEAQLDEMRDALYQLGSQAHEQQNKLVPNSKGHSRKARKHIDRLHKAFKKEK